MRTNSIFGIQFILRMNKMKDNQAPVYCRASVCQRIEISLKKSIAPEDWNVRRCIMQKLRRLEYDTRDTAVKRQKKISGRIGDSDVLPVIQP